MKTKFSIILLALLGLPKAKSDLQSPIRIAAIFDQDGDRKHELAFQHGVERINGEPGILRGKRLVHDIIRIPTGNRYVLIKGINAIRL